MRNRRAGFTLIELMVVIAIIGLLMGILLPVINVVRKKARRAQVISLVHQGDQACNNFRLDYGQLPWLKPTQVKPKMEAAELDDVEVKTYRVLNELRGRGTVNSVTDYLGTIKNRFIKDDVDLSGDAVPDETIVDVWRSELTFRVDPASMDPVIFSRGEDGVDDTNYEDGDSAWYDANQQYTPPTVPSAYSDGDKYPRIYYYLGDGLTRKDDLGNL